MRALILVDIQNDFMPGGPLAVPNGFDVVPVANGLAEKFDIVVATQDWHPAEHRSFASSHRGEEPGNVIDLEGLEQVLWPDHCVQGTSGAEFVDSLEVDRVEAIVRKGTDPAIDSYSGFFDNGHRKTTGLAGLLRERDVSSVYICGVATDYCVKWTALDAIREGFETYVVRDGCRAVELEDGDAEAAWQKMAEAGAHIVESDSIGAAE